MLLNASAPRRSSCPFGIEHLSCAIVTPWLCSSVISTANSLLGAAQNEMKSSSEPALPRGGSSRKITGQYAPSQQSAARQASLCSRTPSVSMLSREAASSCNHNARAASEVASINPSAQGPQMTVTLPTLGRSRPPGPCRYRPARSRRWKSLARASHNGTTGSRFAASRITLRIG